VSPPRPSRASEAEDASLAHVLGRLGVVEARVRAGIARRRGDGQPDDPFRGLYVSDEDVERLLAGGRPPREALAGTELLRDIERRADIAEEAGKALRLRRLARTFELASFDIDLLLVALAPDLDPRFERLYGYLHDDVGRRRATVGLALELAGQAGVDAGGRSRLSAGSALVEGGLLVVEEAERPFLTRSLRVPDRVTMHVLGDDRVDAVVAPLAAAGDPSFSGDAVALARVLADGCLLAYLRDRTLSAARSLACAAFARVGVGVLPLDLARLASGDDVMAVAEAALREARLCGAALVAGPVERLVDLQPAAVRRLSESGWPTALTGAVPWDPAWSREVPLVVDVAPPTGAERVRLWGAALDGDLPPEVDLAEVTSLFRLGPDEVGRAVRAARLRARLQARPLTVDDLHAGARTQNAPALERLARRRSPRVGWNDLVLPEETMHALRELADRAVHGEQVLDEWALAALSNGRGITALFAGEAGTGKTMAAEVIAHALGVDLYTIDLATVVDKYVGETEKNLERIFRATEGVHGILFFDEADALFGKRSEVRDAHDRYANIETAYLLQRMESFDGIAVLATNLRANIDEAFARRLDAVVDFPLPDAERRRRLWDRCLGAVPRAVDTDLDFCAQAFELSGGSIRNIALAAAYRAATGQGQVGMIDLINATKAEYRKLGRLCSEAEFAGYYPLVADTDPSGAGRANDGRGRARGTPA
jgi:Winged helix domain, variant/ATPase family associated with various cellular activities (AAA)